jgi:hypothetical protein
VSQHRSRAFYADQTRRATRKHSARESVGADRELKWSRPEYVELLKQNMGVDVDYKNKPAEDFARATINYVDEDNKPLIVEVTTSWSYVGAGLRLSLEVLGPEYSLSMNSLDSGHSAPLFWDR